jgi:hypothetical protein
MVKPRILLFEKIHRQGMDFLEQQGCEIVFRNPWREGPSVAATEYPEWSFVPTAS